MSRRALATNEEDEVEDTPGVHVRMHIIKNIGAMNLMVRAAPPNPFSGTRTSHPNPSNSANPAELQPPSP